MFKHVTITLGILFGAGLLVGCTPSPEKVCNHFFELEEKNSEAKKKDDDKELDPKLEKLIAKIREKKKEECPKAMTALKQDSADVYKCFAKCITKTKDYDVAKKCDDECDGFKDAWKKAMKKVGDDDKSGDDDSDKKKKKASDDDDTTKKASDDESDTPKKKKKKSSDDE